MACRARGTHRTQPVAADRLESGPETVGADGERDDRGPGAHADDRGRPGRERPGVAEELEDLGALVLRRERPGERENREEEQQDHVADSVPGRK
jgi:hypothetical protein